MRPFPGETLKLYGSLAMNCVLLPNGRRVRVTLKVSAFRKTNPFAVVTQSVLSFIQSAEKKESFSSFSI